MDYSDFEIEDLASDGSFIRWVIYEDPEASKFWVSYQLNHPELRPKIERARVLVLNLRRAEDTLPAAAEMDKTWSSIQQTLSSERSKSSFPFMRIAASIALLLFFTAIWFVVSHGYLSADKPVRQIAQLFEKDFIEKINTTGTAMQIRLSDGTVVTLENNSHLRFHKDFERKAYRKVFLTGEAFFDVAKNPQQPFFVYANEVITKVLGTSFRVKAFDGEKNVMVSVKEGKVSVYSDKGKRKEKDAFDSEVNGVVLMQNQQVVYMRTDDSFNKTLVEAPALVRELPAAHNFNFYNAPVREVFNTLAEAYGVEMIFNEEVLENCYLTAPLGEEPLFEKLKIICRTIGANYELIDAKIVISSTGCGETDGSYDKNAVLN
jgi:hypothetical protein